MKYITHWLYDCVPYFTGPSLVLSGVSHFCTMYYWVIRCDHGIIVIMIMAISIVRTPTNEHYMDDMIFISHVILLPSVCQLASPWQWQTRAHDSDKWHRSDNANWHSVIRGTFYFTRQLTKVTYGINSFTTIASCSNLIPQSWIILSGGSKK